MNRVPALHVQQEPAILTEQYLLHHMKALDYVKQIHDVQISLQLLDTLVKVEILQTRLVLL